VWFFRSRWSWPNKASLNVCTYIHPQKVFPIQMKFVLQVYSRSIFDAWWYVITPSKIKVKATRTLKFEFLPFSTSVSSAICSGCWFLNYRTISKFLWAILYHICPSFPVTWLRTWQKSPMWPNFLSIDLSVCLICPSHNDMMQHNPRWTSRSRDLEDWKFFDFQHLTPQPFEMCSGKWLLSMNAWRSLLDAWRHMLQHQRKGHEESIISPNRG